MATIEDNINRERIEAEDQIRKSLAPTWEEIKNEIIKGKRAQVGEVREWGGIKMRKEANGWVPVKEGGDKSKGEGEQVEGQPVSLEDHAKNASEQALVNATKMSNDPKVREAAHKELMRRKNEEAQETFKAPEEGVKEGEKPAEKKEEKPVEKEESDKVKEGEKIFNEKIKELDEEEGLIEGINKQSKFKEYGKDKSIRLMGISVEGKYSSDESWFSVRPTYYESRTYGKDSDEFNEKMNKLSETKFKTAKEAIKAADEFADFYNK